MSNKNYVIVKYDKILDDIDLRFVIINMFSESPISLNQATIEKFSEVAQKKKLFFLSNAKIEDLAVENGLYKNREDAKRAGIHGDFSSGLSVFKNKGIQYSVYKPVR
jgi:hypothetical protein